MATITLIPDNVDAHVWWLKWVEKDELIGRIIQDSDGRFRITPQGPHWSPMKSFAGFSFNGPEDALGDVQLYFRER